MEVLLELRIVVIQDSEDGKRSVGKKKTLGKSVVNCYRIFAELRYALTSGRALDEAKDFKHSRPHSQS